MNLGTKKHLSVKEIAKIIFNIMKHKKTNIVFTKKLRGEPDKLIASSNLAYKILNWKPKIKIEESIKNMILWEKFKLKNNAKFIN